MEGVITIGLAIPFAVILPNDNKKIMGLTEQECEWVQYNMVSDQGQEDDKSEMTALKGFMLALGDPKMWLLMGILYCVSFPLTIASHLATSPLKKGTTTNSSPLCRHTSSVLSPTSSHPLLAAWASTVTQPTA